MSSCSSESRTQNAAFSRSPVVVEIEMSSSSLANPTRREILNLYRALLRTGRKFCDYNIREYTKRRTIDAFRHNQNLTDSSSVSTAYSDGKAQIEVAKRQAIVYSMYAPKDKSVMEIKQA